MHDAVTAHSLDSAVMTWGLFVENTMQDPKNRRSLASLLGTEKHQYGMNEAARQFLSMLRKE